jgi:hypothetical protein
MESIPEERCFIGNGDFQFRNFIEKESGQVVLVDWEGARLSAFEPEYCIAYQWLLMWNNPEWQREFLRHAIEKFSLAAERFRSVLLLASLRQATMIWYDIPELRQIQLDYFIQALEEHDADVWIELLRRAEP